MTEQLVDSTASVTADERVGEILAIVRAVLSKPELDVDDDVMDHGGTSLSVVRILAETRQSLNLNVNPRDLGGVVTARSLARAAR